MESKSRKKWMTKSCYQKNYKKEVKNQKVNKGWTDKKGGKREEVEAKGH